MTVLRPAPFVFGIHRSSGAQVGQKHIYVEAGAWQEQDASFSFNAAAASQALEETQNAVSAKWPIHVLFGNIRDPFCGFM
jgi:hypothetical protein